MRTLAILIFYLLTFISCPQATAGDTTGAICPARRPPYDPKSMKQCVDACVACDNGTIVTCTTSCTLKGAK
jgi:hypothetical protein